MAKVSRDTALFLSIPDAARMIGCTPERLREAIAAHQIPAIVLGSRKVIARAAIERLAEMVKGDVA
jgi:hypothetical protein